MNKTTQYEIITKSIRVNINGEHAVGRRTYLTFALANHNISISLEKLKKRKHHILKDESFEKNKILDTFNYNSEKYFIFTDENSDVYVSKHINTFLRVRQRFLAIGGFGRIFFIGVSSDISKRIPNFDNVYLNTLFIGKIVRPIKISFFRHISIIIVKNKDILASNLVHNKISIGRKGLRLYQLRYYRRSKKNPIDYYLKKPCKSNLIIVRSTISDRYIVITKVENSIEYYLSSKIKIMLAYLLSKFPSKKHINLFFEKESSRAQESGFYVFEQIMKSESKKNVKNCFILDRRASNYEEIKKKHGKAIVRKYTLRHYYYIFRSKYLIASELPNHVLNPRLYMTLINNVIKKKPLIFLQHGIMFAKPVDNPAARGFYKNNPSANIYKCIISSDLEATQFYRMGYKREDLIKCGLPKFDNSKRNSKAHKIMFMPTYRFWEESDICDAEKIKTTSYYKLFLKIISAFEENRLLERLIISAHPKFAEYIKLALPEYEHIIEPDINNGLENCKIFITDYSSASYDAHYRGAKVIYYWEEKEMLIEKYQAIPPINEENCDGPAVYNTEDLVKTIRKMLRKKNNDFQKYEDRYMKINEFNDNKNTERLISELKKLDII